MAEKDSTMAKQKPDNTLPFRAAVSHIFGNIAESVRMKQFSECQSFLKTRVSDAKFNSIIEKLHEKIVKDLEGTLNKELEGMMSEESLSNGLGKLRQLATEYDPSQPAWRPPGDVLVHLRTIDAMIIDEQTDELTKLVADLENENAFLTKKVSGKRQRKQITDKKIIKATNTALQSLVKMEKIRDDMQSYADIRNDRYMRVN